MRKPPCEQAADAFETACVGRGSGRDAGEIGAQGDRIRVAAVGHGHVDPEVQQGDARRGLELTRALSLATRPQRGDVRHQPAQLVDARLPGHVGER